MSDEADRSLCERIRDLEDQITAYRLSEQSMSRRENEYRSTLDNLLVGIVVHGPDTGILYSNPEASNIIGLTYEQLSGRVAIDPSWQFIHDNGVVMRVEDFPVSKVFTTGKPLHNYGLGVRRPDRDYITWVMVNAIPIFSHADQLEKVIVNFVDVTARKQAESDKLELERQLRQSQKMDALGTMAGGIAHDFNNLLTPIIGYADLIGMRHCLREPDLGYLKLIEDAARRARDLVEKILLLSRNSPPRTQPVKLPELVTEVLALLRASTPPSVTVLTDMSGRTPVIEADSSQIYQAILNLCINAVQAMPTGGKLTIAVTPIQRAAVTRLSDQPFTQFVFLTVRDTGCGMDAYTLEHMFDPFFTTKEKGEARGTGLGLSIASSILKQHGAHIEVDSVLGAGTEFRIYFPVTDASVRMVRPASSTAALPGHVRVLFVDDEPAVNDTGTAILQFLGCQVMSFLDSRQALRAFRAAPDSFDLVITDCSMPGLTGPELIAELRKVRADILILMASGFSNLESPEQLATIGCDAMIAKPYDIARLQRAIAQLLNFQANRAVGGVPSQIDQV